MIDSSFRRGANRLAVLASAVTLLATPLVANDESLVPPSSRAVSPSVEPALQSPPGPSNINPIPLRRPSQSNNRQSHSDRFSTSFWNAAVVLAVICAGLVVVSIGLRRRRRSHGGRLSNEAVEVLGRTAIDGRHTISLVRCGSRVLVLGVDATGGFSPLAEISEPDEVNLLVDLCRLPSGGVAAALGELPQVVGGRVSSATELEPAESVHA